MEPLSQRDDAPKHDGRRRGLLAVKWLAFAAACVLFWRVLASADLSLAAASISAIGPSVGLVLVPFLVAMSLDVLGWRQLYAGLGYRVPFLAFLGTRLAGEAMILSVPGGQVVAEPMAPYLLRARCGLPLPEGFAGLGLKKVLFTMAHGALIFGGAVIGWRSLVLVSPRLVGGAWLPWAVGGIGFAVMATCAFAIVGLLRGTPARRLVELLGRVPLAFVRRFADARTDAFHSTDGHLARAWAGARVDRALAFFVGFWLVEALETWLVLRLLGASLELSAVMSFEAAISLLRALAFFVPAGLGVQDAGYMAMLSALGVHDATTTGAAFVMLKRTKELFWIGVGYALLFGMRGTPKAAETLGEKMPETTKKRVLFVGGSMNQTTQMHAIARELDGEIDAWFSPFWGTGPVEVLYRLGLLGWTIAGGEWRKSTLSYLREHGLRLDDHGRNKPYDLVVKCQDVVRQSNLDDQRVVLVQEGMTDPENLMFRLVQRFDALPRWLASTAATGLSHRYVKFCVASPGYRDLFIRKGVEPAKIEVTGIPNFDDMKRYASCAPLDLEGYVLVVTSDARETFKLDDRMAFIRKAAAIAAGRPTVWKLHPNENHARATAEIRKVLPSAIIATRGKAEEFIARSHVLVTEYSTCSYVGLALGKEVHSHFDVEELRRLMPLQHGAAARNIANVCRELLAAHERVTGETPRAMARPRATGLGSAPSAAE